MTNIIIPTFRTNVYSAVTYDDNVAFEYANSNMWCFPMSMNHLLDADILHSGYTNSWVYYKIDILKSGTTTPINKNPFYVYRKEKCDTYGRWQLFWLNPNGGYDTFTFDRKIDIDYSTERTTYKQRTPAGGPSSFDPYFGGEQIFNIDTTEEVTLRTYLLTQKESQLLIQLFNSPKVYLVKKYFYDPNDLTTFYTYAVPLLVVSKELKYENKANTKEIYYEIKVKSANKKVIQSY